MQTYYHITEKGNVESIMQHGIIPKIGNGPENKAKRKEFSFFIQGGYGRWAAKLVK